VQPGLEQSLHVAELDERRAVAEDLANRRRLFAQQ